MLAVAQEAQEAQDQVSAALVEEELAVLPRLVVMELQTLAVVVVVADLVAPLAIQVAQVVQA